MYEYIHIHTYLYVWIHTYIYIFICTNTWASSPRACPPTHTSRNWSNICMCTHIMCTRIDINVCVHVYTYRYICMRTCIMCTRLDIYVCTNIYTLPLCVTSWRQPSHIYIVKPSLDVYIYYACYMYVCVCMFIHIWPNVCILPPRACPHINIIILCIHISFAYTGKFRMNVYACIYIWMYMRVNIYMYAHKYADILIYLYAYVHVYVYEYVGVHICIHIYTFKHIHIYICIYIYIWIYINIW